MPRHQVITSVSDLASIIKAQRMHMGVKQTEVADMHDLSRFTLIQAESGKGDPKISTLLRVMEAMGLRLVAVPAHLADRISLPVQDDAKPSEDEMDLGDAEWDLDDGTAP